jgi:plasmid stabilization system protein ParE
VSAYLLEPGANYALDEIYEYTATKWDEDQADAYVGGLFGFFDDVGSRKATWRAVPAEFGVRGYFGKYEHHFVYWRMMSSGEVGIVAILHERMHQIDRIRDLFA